MRNSCFASVQHENSGDTVSHRDLVEQLFGEGRLANGWRANEQVQSWTNAVEGAAEIVKTALPTGDFLDGVISLQRVEDFFELFAFRSYRLLISHDRAEA